MRDAAKDQILGVIWKSAEFERRLESGGVTTRLDT
jgi:hypothetical protein